MRNRIRLTESDLRRIVNKSVKRVLREDYYNDDLDFSNPEEIKARIGEAVGEFEQAVLLLYSLSDETAQTLASDGMSYLEHLDNYLASDGEPYDYYERFSDEDDE